MSCVHGAHIRFKKKSLDAGILVLQIAFEVGVIEHNSSIE